MKSCEKCCNCVMQDEGYSNYTVENTYVYCAKKFHPKDGFDRFYGEDKRLNFAENCPGFEDGRHIYVDVDQENTWTEGEKIKIRACGIRLHADRR